VSDNVNLSLLILALVCGLVVSLVASRKARGVAHARHTWAAFAALCVSWPVHAGVNSTPIAIEESTSQIELWPAVTVLDDPTGNLKANDVLARASDFARPATAYGTLGFRQNVKWLHIPLAFAPNAKEDWVFDIGYALLHRADVYVVQDGRVQQEIRLGLAQPFASRPLQSRTMSVELRIAAGTAPTLLIRVEAPGAMVLPITLSTPAAFHRSALNAQMLQGILTCLVLSLLLYSLLQWWSLREMLYLKYALVVAASGLFSIHYFGIGEQYLWTDNHWLHAHIPGLSSVVAAIGIALFVMDVLDTDLSPRLRIAMKAVIGILGASGLGYMFDLVNVSILSTIIGTVGLLPSLLGVPGAFARMRRGDTVGVYFLVSWILYAVASAVMVGMLKGRVDVNALTMHSFQIGATIDMLIFMRITILRSAAIHLAAQRATLERDSLLSLAHSDPLTGLLNRRGLHATLLANLPKATPERQLGVYMLDLDQFKPVNDQYGHDVGDELLVVVASRLRATMRAGDIVARLGGDEFVVMASGLQSERQARELGHKLLDAFRLPFSLSQHTCCIGITIGYALAPVDGNDVTALLKSADAAMYAGKQNGKNCLRRIGVTESQAA
jgi:diguanylate cyclase